MSPGDVVELTRNCELGAKAERAVVVSVEGPLMRLVFPSRHGNRDVRTGTDYAYLEIVR